MSLAPTTGLSEAYEAADSANWWDLAHPAGTPRDLPAEYTRPVVTHNRADEFDEDREGHVYIGRATWRGERVNLAWFLSRQMQEPKRGFLGNPWPVDDLTDRQESIRRFRQLLTWGLLSDAALKRHVTALSGKTLGCWCRHADEASPACHGDVLAEACGALHGEPCDEHTPALAVVPKWNQSNHAGPGFPYASGCLRCYRTTPIADALEAGAPIIRPPASGVDR